MIDAGCDQIGKRFLSDRQPPSLSESELALTKTGRKEGAGTTTGEEEDGGGGNNNTRDDRDGDGRILPDTKCRISRPGVARLALEDGRAVLYHCFDNSRAYRGAALSPMEFELDDAPALESLLTTYDPDWIRVDDLVHGDIEDKVDIVRVLYDEGILAISNHA